MNLPNLKDLVKDAVVTFSHFQYGKLWYDVRPNRGSGAGLYEGESPLFTFPVPVDDTGDGRFLAEDKGLLFMRYIRKHLDDLKAEQALHAEMSRPSTHGIS